MLTVPGAELGKLAFSGFLDRYFTEEGLLPQWSKLEFPEPLSCETGQGSLEGGEAGSWVLGSRDLGGYMGLSQGGSGGSVTRLALEPEAMGDVVAACLSHFCCYHRLSGLVKVCLLAQSWNREAGC